LKPFWPLALPWQPPPLQVNFVKMGTISLTKLTGTSLSKEVTSTSTVALWPPAFAVIVALPSFNGVTRPVLSMATTSAGLAA
jgi:hypothetical protein